MNVNAIGLLLRSYLPKGVSISETNVDPDSDEVKLVSANAIAQGKTLRMITAGDFVIFAFVPAEMGKILG